MKIFLFFFWNNHEGEWWHAGFHLTTAIVGPTILTLPYAFRGLGWGLGFLCLTVMGMVTFYSYYLMSLVLEHCEKAGRRHIRFRELAADVLGRSAIAIQLFPCSYSDSHLLPVLQWHFCSSYFPVGSMWDNGFYENVILNHVLYTL